MAPTSTHGPRAESTDSRCHAVGRCYYSHPRGDSVPRQWGSHAGIRLAVLAASSLVAALLWAPPAWALTPVTFTGPTNFAVGDGPNSVAVGDFNGDGDPDLAVANEFAGSVSVLLGGAGGSFSAATIIATGGFPFAVAVGDFNGDGDPDSQSPTNPPARSWCCSAAPVAPSLARPS